MRRTSKSKATALYNYLFKETLRSQDVGPAAYRALCCTIDYPVAVDAIQSQYSLPLPRDVQEDVISCLKISMYAYSEIRLKRESREMQNHII